MSAHIPISASADEIGKQQRSHRRSAVDQLVEKAVARLDKICAHVKPESQNADQRLQHNITIRHRSRKRRVTGSRSGTIRKPVANADEMTGIHSVSQKEAIRRMIGERQYEVPEETAERQKDDPARPLCAASTRDHAIHQQQKAESCIRQRRGKRRGVGKALEGSIEKEAALEMVEYAGQANQDREPADQIADVAPRGFEVPESSAERSRAPEPPAAPMREVERNVLGGLLKMIDRVRNVDVRGEDGEVRGRQRARPRAGIVRPAKARVGDESLASGERVYLCACSLRSSSASC